MWPYFTVFTMLVAGASLERFKRLIPLRPALALMSSGLLVAFAGLRQVGVGPDDENYVTVYAQVPGLWNWLSGAWTYTYQEFWMEPGYILLNSVIRSLSDNPLFLFMGCALLSVGIACKYFYRMTDYFQIAALLFFSHNYLYRDINQIRAAIAAAFVLGAVWFASSGNRARALLCVFVGASFHAGSVIIILPILLSRFELARFHAGVALIVAYAIGYSEITMALLARLPELGLLSEKVADYSDSDYVDVISLFDLTNLKNTAIIFGFICYWDRLKEKGGLFNVIAWSMLLGTCWRIAFSDFGIMAGRVATFLTVIEVVAVTYFIDVSRFKKTLAVAIAVYALAMLYLNLFVKVGRFPYSLSIL